MKLKKVMALLLVLLMASTAMLACGNQEQQSDQGSSGGDTPGVTDDASSDDDDDDDPEDIVDINVVFMAMGSAVPVGLKDIEDAINEISEKELNIHVNLQMIETGNYSQQVSLMVTSNEKVDLMATLPADATSFSSMASQKQLQPLDDLLAEYGQGIIEVVGDYLKGTQLNGITYAVPTYRTLVSSHYIVMRTDVLEDLDLLEKAQNMTTLADYEEILEAVKNSDKWGHLAGIVSSDGAGTTLTPSQLYLGNDVLTDSIAYDTLGDGTRLISVDPMGDGTIRNNFTTDEYKIVLETIIDFYNKGYIYKDTATNKEMGENMIKANAAFSYISTSEIGIEAAKEAAIGMPVTCVKLVTAPTSTGNVTKFTWAVPASATEPEAAVRFLEAMYTDARIANLLAWGIEGVHYEVVDGIARYLEGQNAESCEYHTVDFLVGNQFLVYPWEGQTADFREIAKTETENAVVSKFLGFSCDTSVVQNELSAVSNVIEEYRPGLESGSMGMDRYEEFIQKLESAGVQVILDEYQKQLDEWLAGK